MCRKPINYSNRFFCGSYMHSDSVQKILFSALSILLLLSMVLLSREAALYVTGKNAAANARENKRTVVIDSGHGGIDPGKISVDGSLEKDINLAIALKLQTYLEADDVSVIMTRTTDTGLYDENSSNKKVQDMKNRVQIMEDSGANLVVSIHQNSYTSPSVKGAQVFYYAASTESKLLADTIQEELVSRLDPDNHRVAKANDSYYLLKKTSLPIVIVECGFLSNPDEAALLNSEAYQDQVAWAIHMAILTYLNKNE